MNAASIGNYKEHLIEALHLFECYKDQDVQDFLRNKAIDFEKRGFATTYLLLNKDAFANGELKIKGYFSLTHKTVTFKPGVSRSVRSKLTGQRDAQNDSFVLIGQLGKYMARDNQGCEVISDISFNDLIKDTLGIIKKSSNYIVSRNIIIECKPIPSVHKIYQDFGFVDLQFDGELYTMYLKLENDIRF